ncbi:MAG: hypothetical protein WA996_10175 [Candidatus Promineifilaceae bacterium]
MNRNVQLPWYSADASLAVDDKQAFVDRIRSNLTELLGFPNFVCYVKMPQKDKPGKTDKKPINPHTGGMAKCDDSSTWGTFEEAAVYHLRNPRIDGVGFQLGETPDKKSGIVGVDLDNCVDSDGQIEPWAADIVKHLNTYCELSPSGTGLHLFLYGELPPRGRKKGDIEMYDCGRFITLTGDLLESHDSTETS